MSDVYRTAPVPTLDETYLIGRHHGERAERERIIKLLEKHTHPEAEAEYLIDCNLCERYYGVGLALALIKGEQKVIHTHEIEVFGAPCDCGTRHEYCGECSWVEPCEPEGEQK